MGCSPKVYGVMSGESRHHYEALLAHKDLLAEHPRTGQMFLDAVQNMKPFFKKDVSYGWAFADNSRIGASLGRGLSDPAPAFKECIEIGRFHPEDHDWEDDDDDENVQYYEREHAAGAQD
ncbi:hypothetical protein H0H87_003915, partial [Tephrocybe sp. NHM501043]